jgi:hypothetical protein
LSHFLDIFVTRLKKKTFFFVCHTHWLLGNSVQEKNVFKHNFPVA